VVLSWPVERRDDGAMATDAENETTVPADTEGAPVPRGMTVYGRQGSPTVSVALPFSKIKIEENVELHAAVVELADLVQRLALASSRPKSAAKVDLDAVAEQAEALVARLGGKG
jgi:hypothetical protein